MSRQRPLDLTLISARDLKDVNFLAKMEVYAVAWLSSDRRSQRRISTDREGGRNPSWSSATLRFFVPEGSEAARLVLHVLLRCERALGDRDVGEVRVPVKELESTPGANKSPQFVSYEVRRPSGKAKGVLNFSFKFSEPIAAPAPSPYPAAAATTAAPYPTPAPAAGYPGQATGSSSYKDDEPVTAYPADPSTAYPPRGAAAAYPPPQGYSAVYPPPPPQPYGHGTAPPAGYGYYPPPPPPAYGYGAPPVVQAPPPPKKNKFGMGLGAGLLGGALGGLLIGDMVSDAGAYDAGYDAGFGDAGGFNF